LDNRKLWFHLVPPNDTDSTERVRDLFACVATLMSQQLRQLVLDSLAEFLDLFLIHQVSPLTFTLSVLSLVIIVIIVSFIKSGQNATYQIKNVVLQMQ